MRVWEDLVAIATVGAFVAFCLFSGGVARVDGQPSILSAGHLDTRIRIFVDPDRVSTIACRRGDVRIRPVRALRVYTVPDTFEARLEDTWELSVACEPTDEESSAEADYRLDLDEEAVLRCQRSEPIASVGRDHVITAQCLAP